MSDQINLGRRTSAQTQKLKQTNTLAHQRTSFPRKNNSFFFDYMQFRCQSENNAMKARMIRSNECFFFHSYTRRANICGFGSVWQNAINKCPVAHPEALVIPKYQRASKR